jgi:F420-dependent oxidoreductase-like protein
MKGIDFGVQIEPQYGFTYKKINDIASEAEKLGFESIWISDHFFMTDDSLEINCLECWTLLTALACETKKLRLGAMVSAQSYRNPALLANVAASLDNISEGRLNFGIGAGWKEVEYRAYGYKFPGAGRRIKQLDETIEIAKRMWTEEKATYIGKYYKVEEALCMPKPLQKPLPIWVGGTGNKTLRVAAKHAHAINFAWTQTPSFFEERLEVLKNHCENIGTDFRQIKKSAGLMLSISDITNQEKVERDPRYIRYLSRQKPVMIASTEEVAERIKEYIALGVTHFILRFHFGEEITNMRTFMDQVVPHL